MTSDSSDEWTLFAVEHHAKTSPLRGNGPGSRANDQSWSSTWSHLRHMWGLDGSCTRTSPDFSPATGDGISPLFSITWPTAAFTTSSGALLTASTSESPNVAVECSLSQVLLSHAEPRYFLSAKAATGILRRASRRGRTLPQPLEEALQAVASSMHLQPTDSVGGGPDDNLAQAGHLISQQPSTPVVTMEDSAQSQGNTLLLLDAVGGGPRLASSSTMQSVASTVTTGTGVRYDPDTESLVVT